MQPPEIAGVQPTFKQTVLLDRPAGGGKPWLAGAAPVAVWLGEFSAVALAVLLVAFALLVALLSRPPTRGSVAGGAFFAALMMLNGV